MAKKNLSQEWIHQEFFDPFTDIEQAIEKKGIDNERANEIIERADAAELKPIVEAVERKAESEEKAQFYEKD